MAKKTGFTDYQEYAGMQGQPFKRCYESHPPLVVGDYKVYGGSCSKPIVLDADVYIGFDTSMNLTKASWPWETVPVQEVFYKITDMCAPQSPADFTKMIDWVAKQLQAGKKVHMGCIGGHGRTGTALSALVKVMTGNVDATEYVRAHYCKKAVESKSQVKFLETYFGIKPVKPAKDYSPKGSSFSNSSSTMVGLNSRGSDDRYPIAKAPQKDVYATKPQSPKQLSIWGD